MSVRASAADGLAGSATAPCATGPNTPRPTRPAGPRAPVFLGGAGGGGGGGVGGDRPPHRALLDQPVRAPVFSHHRRPLENIRRITHENSCPSRRQIGRAHV